MAGSSEYVNSSSDEKQDSSWENEFPGIDLFEEALEQSKSESFRSRHGYGSGHGEFLVEYRDQPISPDYVDVFRAGNTEKKQVYSLPESAGV